MLIDTHVHSSGISPCSRRNPCQLIAEYLADKTDGFVLANHCLHDFTTEIGYKNWCEKYVEEYRKIKTLGDKYGVRVFFGIEVTPDWQPCVHLLIYGITSDDLLKSPELYALSLEELYAYCEENGFLLYQAHPYRNGMVPQNPEYLHGYEINCHPGYKTNMREEVSADAKNSNLRLICGSDFHGDHYKPKCGTYIPDSIKTERELAEYLRNNQPELEIMDVINVTF